MNISTTFNTKYKLSIRGFLIYLSALLVVGLLFAVKTWGILPAFGLHYSNFAISFVLLTSFGLSYLAQGGPLKGLLIAALVLVAANFLIESYVNFINVRDLVDAVFGTIGTLAGLLVLLLISKFGIVRN